MSLPLGIRWIHRSLIIFCLGMIGICYQHYTKGTLSGGFTLFSCFAFIGLAVLLGSDLYAFKKEQQ